MMHTAVLLFLTIITGVFLFHQSDYKITFERMELFNYNRKFVRNITVVTFKYNRTTTTVNATFTYLKDLNSNVQVIVQAYKFASNEYRLFPLRFQFDFCVSAARNEFGLGRFYTCGNFTRCPIKKGTFHICNWSPDESRFPPHIPDGQYMIDLSVVQSANDIMTLRFYATAYRPVV